MPTLLRPVGAATARRFFARRHLLAPPRSLPSGPEGVMAAAERLGSFQFDPLEVAGRNHDLVLHARVADYTRAVGDDVLYGTRQLFETYNKGLSLVPTAELPYYRVYWDREQRMHAGTTFDEHAPLVEELLERIRSGGPLSSTDVEPRAAIEWYWRPTNQVRAVLEALAQAGVLGLARREGNRRVYDLTERLYPAELLAHRPAEEDQIRHKLLSRYRAHGMLGRSGSAELWYGTGIPPTDGTKDVGRTRRRLTDEMAEDGRLVPVAVEGLKGERFVLGSEVRLLEAAAVEVGEASGGQEAGLVSGSGLDGLSGVTLLAPLDPFVWDRDFIRRLHGFDYVWEVYVPERKRKWGYYVLPILFGDRLVGRIEPRIDRKAGAIRVLDLWWEAGFDPLAEPGFVDGLAEALQAHRRFAGMGRIVLPRTARHRDLARDLRPRLG
ncbi:MAG TPA: crosslink repair DNA glycosylase YcaQ family protein [Candidatus Limnocylindrales bacterium]